MLVTDEKDGPPELIMVIHSIIAMAAALYSYTLDSI